MTNTDIKKLDNPVWHSLSESHKKFSIEYDNIKFYHPDYCPFGGFIRMEDIAAPIAEYAKLTDNYFIVGEKPALPNPLKLKSELVCLQMVAEQSMDKTNEEDIVQLDEEDSGELAGLVNLVQPGYFKKKTQSLGSYYGIFKNNELIAVTGERMAMGKFVEVSAVITHPDHTGKGYAKQLVAHTVNNIFNKDKIPYLHVAETNTGAIKLYEKSGFQTRRKISFWNIIK